MLVVNFYTKLYTYWAKRLEASCKRFGLRYEIEWQDQKVSWERTCSLKGPFVAKKLKQHKEPIMWLDADAEIVRELEGLDPIIEGFDCAVHEIKSIAQSGCVLLMPTEKGFQIADRWAQICQEKPLQWDQNSLSEAYGEIGGARVHNLDVRYNYVFDNPDLLRDPYIIQYQASRETKRIMRSDPQIRQREKALGNPLKR